MQHKIIVYDNLNVDKGYHVPLCLDSSKMLLFELLSLFWLLCFVVLRICIARFYQ